jgi:hypothetical protein
MSFLVINQETFKTIHNIKNFIIVRSISTHQEKLRAILVPVATFQALHFQTGKHELSLVNDTQLNEIAKALANMPNKGINIKGHADTQTFAGKTQAESERDSIGNSPKTAQNQ